MYEVVIKKITKEDVTEQGDWEIIEKRPYTDEEFSEANTRYQADDNTHLELKTIRGYTPDKVVEKTVEEEVYRQKVENLDISGVIDAVNKPDKTTRGE